MHDTPTKDAILQAAGTLFAERGYDCTPIADIADRAGVASGTIIYHFKRKERLLAELALRYLNGLHDRCQAAAARGASGLEGVGRLVDAFHGYLRDHLLESAAYYRNLPAEKLKGSADLHPEIAASERRFALLLQCLVLLGVNDGSILARDAAGSARTIQAMLLGGAWMVLFQNGDRTALAEGAARSAHLLLAGNGRQVPAQNEGGESCSRA